MKKAKVIKMQRVAGATSNSPGENKILPDKEIAEHYAKIIKADPFNRTAYSRLMTLYRKMKEYKRELDIINRAIRAFEMLYNSNKKNTDKKVHSISKKLNKSLGLTDNKGKMLYEQEPISTWKKRKDIVLKKMEGL